MEPRSTWFVLTLLVYYISKIFIVTGLTFTCVLLYYFKKDIGLIIFLAVIVLTLASLGLTIGNTIFLSVLYIKEKSLDEERIKKVSLVPSLITIEIFLLFMIEVLHALLINTIKDSMAHFHWSFPIVFSSVTIGLILLGIIFIFMAIATYFCDRSTTRRDIVTAYAPDEESSLLSLSSAARSSNIQ